MARKFDLSVALFAHGWTNEKADDWDQFIDNEYRYLYSFHELTVNFCPFLTHQYLDTKAASVGPRNCMIE